MVRPIPGFGIGVLLLGLLLAAPQPLLAQTPRVRGRVAAAADTLRLQSAKVRLLQSGGELEVAQQNVGRNGRFRLTAPRPGRFVLQVAALGYETYSDTLQLEGGTRRLGRIGLRQNQTLLESVQIQTKTPPAVMKGDTVEFNADAYDTNPNADAERLIEKMPSLGQEQSGLEAQGEQVTRIYVDGKPFFGNDPKAVLRNLPAGAIKKVQVYDEKSETAKATGFNDGNTFKTVNIILKDKSKKGHFGEFFAGYGTNERYDLGGNLSRVNGERRLAVIGQFNNVNQQNFSNDALAGITGSGTGPLHRRFSRGSDAYNFVVPSSGGVAITGAGGLYYTDTWGENFDVTLNYLYNQRDNTQRERLFRRYVQSSGEADNTQRFSETSTAQNLTRNHRFSGELEWQPDSLNTFRLRPNLTLRQDDGTTVTEGRTYRQADQDSIPLSAANSDFDSELLNYTGSASFLYSHSFPTEGRNLALESLTTLRGDRGDSRLWAENLTFVGGIEDPEASDTTDQRSDLTRNGWVQTTTLTYTEPAGPGRLLTGYEANYSQDDADKQTFRRRFDPELGQYTYSLRDTGLSNAYQAQYLAHRPKVGYQLETGKLTLNASVVYEVADLWTDQQFPVQSELRRRFANFKPTATLNMDFDKYRELRIEYTTRTTPPSVNQLQTAIDNSNPLQLEAGNPQLQQQFSHEIDLNYDYSNPRNNQSLYLFLGVDWSNRYFSTATLVPETDTVVQTDVAGDGVRVPNGGQLTRPVNMDDYFRTGLFVSYGIPLGFVDVKTELESSIDYSQTPSIINGRENLTRNLELEGEIEGKSNIGPALDFTYKTEGSQYIIRNTLDRLQSNNYFVHQSEINLDWTIWQGLFTETTFTEQVFFGLDESVGNNQLLWQFAAGWRFFPKDQLEAKVTVFDVFGRNRDISRQVTGAYIQDRQRNALDRYVMLTLTYQFRQFSGVGEPDPRELLQRGQKP